MNEYNFNVKFEKGRISSNLKKLVQNDYNSTKINFTFDKEGRKLFKMLYPDGTAYITQIDNDELLFGVGVLSQDGTYEVEIALYTEDGRLTDYATTKFDVRAELIQSDEIVEVDDRLPILDSLISDVQGAKTEIEDAIQYATEQGDYAKKQANRNFDAIEEATKIVDNFEENVNEYKENFDNNADLKTNDFNNNAAAKTTVFNQNVTDKIEDFNENAAEKVSAYNSNADEKLNTYNSNATEKLEEYNNNADNLISNVKETRNELERVKNDVLETGEASGNYLTLNDSTMAEYQELEVEGVCKQVVTTGKNLYDLTGEVVGHKLPQTLSAGTYTFSVDKTNVTSLGVRLSKTTDTSADSVLGNLYKTTPDGQRVYLTLETTFEANYINISSNGGVKFPMLESGSVVTEYEPYTGLKPSPSPDYPQEISVIENELKVVSCNKNLFDKENVNVLNAFIDNTNNKIGLDNNCRSIFIKCKPDTNYVISKKVTPRFIVGATSIIPEANVICSSIVRNDSATNISFKTGTNDKYLIVYLMNSYSEEDFNDCLNSLQIEENTQATPFEEHLETVINANLGNEFVGKINDNAKDILRASYNEDDGEYHLYLDKTLGKTILDGTQPVQIRDGKNYKIFCIDLEKRAIFNDGYRLEGLLSNKYKENTREKIWSNSVGFSYGDTTYFYRDIVFYSEETNEMNVEQFKQWLKSQYDNGNPIEVVYRLLNPYTVDLGKIDMPITYDETTNLFTESNLLPAINAKYYRNFTETVRNLQINNDTLKNELASIEKRLSALETAQVSVVNESEVVE